MADGKSSDEVIGRAETLRDTAKSALNGFVGNKLDHLECVVLWLMSRILEMHNAARNLMEHSSPAPIATIVLARAQYESYLQLKFILDKPTPAERKALAENLLKFSSYETVESIGDRDAYRTKLTVEEQKNFDRRIQIHDEVEIDFGPEQKKQKKQGKRVTWNGLSIAETARAVGESGHGDWYGVMSLVAHSKPSMIHKSITIYSDGYVLGNVEKGERDAIEWFDQMNKALELAIDLVRTAKT